MKAWTDKECDVLREDFEEKAAAIPFASVAMYERALIRAAVDEARAEHHADCTKGALLLAAEARREEREACAEFIKTHHVVSSNVEPFHWIEKDDPRSHIGPDINQRTLAAAILVRGEKEPRDAER